MTLTELKARVKSGEIDTIITGFPDPFGRLMGKRFRADYFIKSVVDHGTHGCNYLLTVNMEMDPLDGFSVANWESGFGDFAFHPDMSTLRLIPWQPGSALVLCDLHHSKGTSVAEAPRTLLQTQVKALEKLGWLCNCATELEFYLFNQTYSEALAGGHRTLIPSSDYRIDYHLFQTTRDEPIMRTIRNSMPVAGVPVESSKGEWSRGQHEINFTYAQPQAMADMHTIFKQGVKEIAVQHGKSASFMAKYSPSEAGNSCHIHMSLWKGGKNAFWDPRKNSGTQLFRQFLGGLMKYSPELCLFYAPTINSYKRYQGGSWAPTRMAWSTDNRTCGFRVVGEGSGFRIENRMPGADANPYLALGAMLAAGMAGVRDGLDCGDAYQGNAYTDERLVRLPSTLTDAVGLFAGSRLAETAFGRPVVEFYSRHARLELDAFNNAVTDWEKGRYFERI